VRPIGPIQAVLTHKTPPGALLIGRRQIIHAWPSSSAAGRRLLRQHAGRKLADDVLLLVGEPVES
jgi:hypothetical protein